jgi:WD40 repeat protein
LGESLKFWGCCGIFIGIFALIILAIIVLRPSPRECLERSQPILQAGSVPDASELQLLTGESLSQLQRLARLKMMRSVTGDFTIDFSADSSLIAIAGIGYISPVATQTLLWKLKTPELCVLEVGDIGYGSYRNQFVSFSPDSRSVLLRKNEYGSCDECYSLWDVHDNQLMNRFYDAGFVRQEDEIRLEYQRDTTVSKQTSVQHWQVVDSITISIRVFVDHDTVRLVDQDTGNKRQILLGNVWDVRDIEFSPDGKLLALAFYQRDDYAPYLASAYVELWGITDDSINDS